MLASWHNFLYVSFDPAGFVSVDKPPLGFWIQTLSAAIFGFSGFSLVLPQALAGIASATVLYLLVSRTWGRLAGTVAGLTLALTPINVVTSRNNAVDTQLLLVLLLAAWAITIASERSSRKWLLIGFALVGVGFNVKMLQAFLVLPAFYAVYFFASSSTFRERVRNLAFATTLLALVSLSWVAVVDLTPANQRPFVGASGNNRELSLVMGHNGTARLVSSPGSLQAQDIGHPGPLRFIDHYFAGQVSWFLPLAIIGIALLLAHRPWLKSQIGSRERLALLLWGGWLLTFLVFFSIISFFHIYYLVILTPAIAALTGIAIARLLRSATQPGWRRYRVLIALVITLAFHIWILAGDTFWSERLLPPLLVCALASGIFFFYSRIFHWPDEGKTSDERGDHWNDRTPDRPGNLVCDSGTPCLRHGRPDRRAIFCQ